MTVFCGKLFTVIFLFLTGTSVLAEVPVSHSGHDDTAHHTTGSPAANSARPGMQWQILPGEDIPQIARLMFPGDAVTRDAFIRAVIHTNPEHFPGGVYQPLPAGTQIHIPDLRTIGTYAKPAARAHKPSSVQNSNKRQPQAPAPAISGLDEVLQLITQLEQIAENEANELNTLLKRIESLEKQIAALQSQLTASIAAASERHHERADTFVQESPQPLPSTEAPVIDNAQPIENAITLPPTSAQQPPIDPIPPVETHDAPMESSLFADNIFLLGILLMLLIVFLIVRNYQRIKEKLAKSRDGSSLPFDPSERHQYEALLLRRSDDKKAELPQNPPEPPGQLVSEARALIEQENPEAAIELLQKQLAKNKQDIPGWLLLFELLYKASNKRDFKKNARRFKRLGEFPDIWKQIQKLGNQLEPNESLYFDEQKRKEKFFSDTADTDR